MRTKINNERFRNIISGSNHEKIEDAIAADLVSALPIIGSISDFLRLIDSESRPQKVLQALDLITSPIPVADVFTPTNTLLYLNKKGALPFDLEKLDKIMKIGRLPIFKRR